MLLERETEFETLYRAYYRRVYHYILRRIGDPETAQELTGDVFRIARRKFDTSGSEPHGGLPSLCAVAHNLLGNEYRETLPPYGTFRNRTAHRSAERANLLYLV